MTGGVGRPATLAAAGVEELGGGPFGVEEEPDAPWLAGVELGG